MANRLETYWKEDKQEQPPTFPMNAQQWSLDMDRMYEAGVKDQQAKVFKQMAAIRRIAYVEGFTRGAACVLFGVLVCSLLYVVSR